MQNREVSLVSFAAAILDMDGEVLSETWYTTDADGELACADARRTGAHRTQQLLAQQIAPDQRQELRFG